jgi:2-polyprenyl-3-methyl-5-hydroxy-6-metoxy-1,4-benzoquinol methylase
MSLAPLTTRLRRKAKRVLGRQSSAASPAEALKPKAAKPLAVGPGGIPGRHLRVVAPVEEGDLVLDREGSDPTEAAAVRAGWQLIEAHERLSRRAARNVFGRELEAWHRYAEETTPALKAADKISPVEESRNNLLRYRRTMDFARPGERVFDVGVGHGYLAAQLVTHRQVASYHGIEVMPDYLPVARELFENNGLADADIDLRVGDLYDLTREDVAATGANLVICCEVLEHVPDAERALRTLADALPDGADLLFSVPLHGRGEATWGHVSVFDVARLKVMLDQAGLYAHHVEPLANVWSLIVASRDPGLSERVRAAGGRPPHRANVPLVKERDFVYPKNTELTAIDGTDVVADPDDDELVRCRLSGSGGVSVPVTGLESLRLFFDFTDTDQVERFVATAYTGTTQVGEWSWSPQAGQFEPRIQRFALRPGERGARFVSGPHKDVAGADRVELRAVVGPGATAAFGFKVAYLP